MTLRPEPFFYATNFSGLPEVALPTDVTAGEFPKSFIVSSTSKPGVVPRGKLRRKQSEANRTPLRGSIVTIVAS